MVRSSLLSIEAIRVAHNVIGPGASPSTVGVRVVQIRNTPRMDKLVCHDTKVVGGRAAGIAHGRPDRVAAYIVTVLGHPLIVKVGNSV